MPLISWGYPTTAHLAASGLLKMALSTSAVPMRWPLTLMTSSARPVIQRYLGGGKVEGTEGEEEREEGRTTKGGRGERATNGVNVMNGTNEVKRRTTRVKVEGVAKLILNRFFSSPHTRTRPRRAWHDPH